MNLLIHELGHLLFFSAFALTIGLLLPKYYSYKNYLLGLFFTWFMDLDHLFDYFLYTGINTDTKRFFEGEYFAESGKIILPFHSWELVFLVFLVFFLSKDKVKNKAFLVVGVAYFVHIIYDVITYGFDWTAYFLVNRIIHGFDIALFS